MKVIVTGGEGFIGRNIINEANSKGWYTISVDIDQRKSDANESHRISLLDRDKLREIFKGVDYVFHNAPFFIAISYHLSISPVLTPSESVLFSIQF